jgi:pyridinium-3,5-bisthiocarboxylic acid mononucleotide nickel chelatase
MRIAYFEPIGGASGNMLLGALIDAGADAGAIESELRTIPVRKPWTLRLSRVVKVGIAATHVSIDVPGEDGAPDHVHHPRGHDPHGVRLADVLAILAGSALDDGQRRRARAIYERLAEAEALVHGEPVDAIHFHEVGATDAILDVAGACVALDLLGVDAVRCAPFPAGRGALTMQHGAYPNPPPATAELLRGFATYDGGVDAEMVTTTGAAILTTLATTSRGERPAMITERIGYGAGSSDFPIPNVLRVSVGEAVVAAATAAAETTSDVVVLEANVDDMSPQYFELALERVFAAGALDAWLVPIVMKKSRPGIIFGAIAPLDRERACAHAMLTETTTLGVRVRREHRHTLARSVEEVSTALGVVRVKTAVVDGRPRRTLEYADVLRIAREQSRPIPEVARDLERLLAEP